MDTFIIGQTVTPRGTEAHGLIVDMYTHNGTQKVSVFHNRKTPPRTYDASDLMPYMVQSPDMVMLMTDHGALYPFEVADVAADYSAVYVYDLDGQRHRVPMNEVTRVIPATIARLAGLYGSKES